MWGQGEGHRAWCYDAEKDHGNTNKANWCKKRQVLQMWKRNRDLGTDPSSDVTWAYGKDDTWKQWGRDGLVGTRCRENGFSKTWRDEAHWNTLTAPREQRNNNENDKEVLFFIYWNTKLRRMMKMSGNSLLMLCWQMCVKCHWSSGEPPSCGW